MARDFTTKVLSDGEMDIPLNIWVLWHAKEALLGHQPLLYANLLYYPVGTSMLTQSPGPLLGLLALPFWGFGAAAAYNATLLLALWLSGVSMYLLARDLGLDRLVALFSAAVLMAAPMVLGGLPVHMDKVFIALLPLANLSKSLQNSVKLVLAGDPRQLGSVVISAEAKTLGLDISLLERLMLKAPYAPKADTKDRNAVTELADRVHADSRITRSFRTGRNHQPGRPHLFDFFDRNLIVAGDPQVCAKLAQMLHQVVSKGIVIVYYENHSGDLNETRCTIGR